MWPLQDNSLGTYTDSFVRFPATQFSKDDDFVVYKTPTRADFWWGAYLVSRTPVTKENLAAALYRQLHCAEKFEPDEPVCVPAL